jgi:hypothetical protein
MESRWGETSFDFIPLIAGRSSTGNRLHLNFHTHPCRNTVKISVRLSIVGFPFADSLRYKPLLGILVKEVAIG